MVVVIYVYHILLLILWFVDITPFVMATKNEKASPIRIPEEVFGMCNSDQEPLLLQLRNQIDGCKTIFEEMNFFGLLKQEISRFFAYIFIDRRSSSSKCCKVYCTCLYSPLVSGIA